MQKTLGHYTSSKNEISLNCNRAELHASLAGEIEAWCDHELEMRAQLFRMASPSQGAQDSWFAVTTYYWATFSATLLLRLLGRPVFRMGATELEVLKKLGASNIFPTEGTFMLIQGTDTSATSRSITLKKLRTNYHQSLWTGLVSQLDEIDKNTRNNNPNSTETSLISEVLRAMRNRHGILSDIRNLVNYKAEIAFPANRSGLGFSIIPSVNSCEKLDAVTLLGLLHSATNAAETGTISRYDRGNGSFLFWTAVTLSVLAHSLYREISTSFSFDRSWLKRRMLFGESDSYGIPKELRAWAPFA